MKPLGTLTAILESRVVDGKRYPDPRSYFKASLSSLSIASLSSKKDIQKEQK